MRNSFIKFVAFIGIFSLLVIACTPLPKGNLSKREMSNLSYIYNPGSTTIHPLITVFHISDSISYFYVGFSASELLFNQANATGSFLTQIRIHFELSET